MTYLLNKSQKAIQKAAYEFAKGEFDENFARESDKNSIFPAAIWNKATELGFIGIHHPEKLSGGGMGTLENVLVCEAFTIKDSTIGAALMLLNMACEWLVKSGSNAQKSSLLPDIFEGRKKTGFAMNWSVLDTGNDATTLKLSSQSDQWQVTGVLENIINGKEAEVLFLLCGSSESADLKNNISMLVLETEHPGIEIKNEASLLGLRMAGMTNARLSNVVVNEHDFIGKPGNGLKQGIKSRPAFHLQMAAIALGIAQGSFNRALAHVKGREQFGKKLAGFQMIQHKLAQMAIQIEQARCLTYEAARIADTKKSDPKMSAMANLAATSTAVSVSYEAIQLLGGYGYTNEYDVERCYRDAKTLQLLSGHKHDMLDQVSAGLIGKLKK